MAERAALDNARDNLAFALGRIMLSGNANVPGIVRRTSPKINGPQRSNAVEPAVRISPGVRRKRSVPARSPTTAQPNGGVRK